MPRSARYTGLGALCAFAFAILAAAGARGAGWTIVFGLLALVAAIAYAVGWRESTAERRERRERRER